MKKGIQNFLIIICTIAFTTSCSTDNETITPDQETITTDNKNIASNNINSRRPEEGLPPDFVEAEPELNHPVPTPIVITYEPNIPSTRIDNIRTSFTNDGVINIISIRNCQNSSLGNQQEVWYTALDIYCPNCKPSLDPKIIIETNGGVSRALPYESNCSL